MGRIIFFILLISLAFSVNAQFTDIGQSLTGMYEGVPCWGDYDGDGDLDLHISGYNGSTRYWKIYGNNSGTFTDLGLNLVPARYSFSTWCDWDHDGDLDGITTGWGSGIITTLWRNNGYGSFSTAGSLAGVNSGSMAWADYDNDGDEDLLLTGYYSAGTARIAYLYRNDSGTFTNVSAGLQGVEYSASSWCDWDNDGDYDILYTGHTGTANFVGSYRNDNGTFTYVDLGITALRVGSISWADCDADGDADLLLTGYTGTSGFADIYINDKGTFTAASAGLPALYWSSGEWADYDSDGDFDILLSGTTDGTAKYTGIYTNNSGLFEEEHITLEGVWKGAAKWGDYDNDGDLDIVVMGESASGNITKIYRNDYTVTSKEPNPPTNLTLSEDSGKLVFSYDAGYDSPDPVQSLTYNIRINQLNTAISVMMPHSNSSGVLSIPASGNVGYELEWKYNRVYLPQETVSADWEVQTVDLGYIGSGFAGYTNIFQFHDLDITSDSQLFPGDSLFISSAYADSISYYTLQIDDDPAFGSPFSETVSPAKTSGKDAYLAVPVDQLSCWNSLSTGIDYYWRIRPEYSSSSRFSGFTSAAVNFKLLNEFSEITTGMTGISEGTNTWGDYDNDGDLDVLITGNTGASYITKLYRNDGGGVFTEIVTDLPDLYESDAEWGDFDNDGDLDIAISGNTGTGYASRIFRNDSGGIFDDISAGLHDLRLSSLDWGDYDNDGDLDLFLSGATDTYFCYSYIYRNDNGIFTDINAGIEPAGYGSGSFGDYDCDGDLDLLITGFNGGATVTKIYRNDSGIFTDINVQAYVPQLYLSSSEWLDFDSDSDMDFIISGDDAMHEHYTLLYINTGSDNFSESSSIFTGAGNSSLDFGDIDNDGDLDIISTGDSGSGYISVIYLNNSGNLTNSGISFIGVQKGGCSLADYDNDGDLDIMISGDDGTQNITKLYNNHSVFQNTQPLSPAGMNASVSGSDLLINFAPGSDNETPSTALTYNIGIEIEGEQVKPEMSNQTTGYRKITGYGNIGQNTSWTLVNALFELLPQEALDITVRAQTVDNCFAGSAFATLNDTVSGEQLELVNDPYLYTNDSLFWSSAYSDSITNYTIQADNDPSFTAPFEDTLDKTKSPKALYITKAIDELSFYTSLTKDLTYYWRIRPNYSNPSRASVFSETPGSFKLIPEFSDISATITGLAFGGSFWGDYDNDGDLDVLVTGQDATLQSYTLIYRNNGDDTFTDINAGLIGVSYSYADWGDYDCDGDLDIVIMGNSPVSQLFIYRNDAGTFSLLSTSIGCNGYGTVKWGDKDNDGDLDLLITGQDESSNEMSKIYENNGGTFNESNIGELFPLEWSCGDWADFDNDGDLDIVMSGRRDTEYWTYTYINNNGIFSESGSYIGVYRSSVTTGDYNNDGYIDAVVCGNDSPGTYKTMFLTNYSGSLSYDMDIPGVQDGSVDLGDYDNDGDLDILITGYNDPAVMTDIYLNDNGNFIYSQIDFQESNRGRASWGDYDGDGDLDILVSGRDGGMNYFTSVYRNNSLTANTVPSAPSALSATGYSDHIHYQFSAGSDTETPAAGLYYNANIEINDDFVKPAMSDLSTGTLRLPVKGNLNKVTSYDLKREIYPQESVQSICKIQTVDAGFAASPFASLTTTLYGQDLELVCEPVMYMNDSLSWSSYCSSYVLTYTVQVDDDINFGSPFEQTVDKSKNSKAAYITKALDEFSFAASLLKGTTYYWRIKPNYSDFRNSVFSQTPDSFTIWPDFTEISAGLTGLSSGSTSWGDYDNDGDLDLVITGSTGSVYRSKIYRNDGGIFNDINAGLTNIDLSSSDWGDYDNDGDLDLVISGRVSTSTFISKIYRNDSGSFVDTDAGLAGFRQSSCDWGDYDNDGDLDLVIAGQNSSFGIETKLYRNNNGSFTEIETNLTDIFTGSLDWGDFDNDGDLDLVLTGPGLAEIYRNDVGSFTKINANLPDVDYSFADWGDYDNDGDLDLVIAGRSLTSGPVTKIYRNDAGSFNNIEEDLTGVYYSTCKWGDYDNDGDLDLIISGWDPSYTPVTRIYRNDNTSFVEINTPMAQLYFSSSEWGDYDNDGDLDIVISGCTSTGTRQTIIYRNNAQIPNTVPLPPAGVTLTPGNNLLSVGFSQGSDGETPSPGLSYNIEMGVNEYTGKTAMSDLSTGYRKIVAQGNIGQVNSWTFNSKLPEAIIPQEVVNLWCKVQSVDHCFAGSAFAEGNAQTTNRDLQFLPREYMTGTDELVWEFVMSDSIASYTVQMATDTYFEPCYKQTLYLTKNEKTGYIGVALEDLDFFGSLTDDTEYFWRIRPDHVNPSKQTVFNSEPNSFIFNPSLVPPENITITVDGQYIVLDWSGVKADKAEPDYYTVYSSNDPYAEFPAGWTEETSTSNKSCILISASAKKFYCVTASNFAAKKIIKTSIKER
ncbi:MAG TPA: VCBS repeat-containing protein [Clostridiales bacterium]|nr:VCBS repeat-containing protein [Clostridiales bacterium]